MGPGEDQVIQADFGYEVSDKGRDRFGALRPGGDNLRASAAIGEQERQVVVIDVYICRNLLKLSFL